MNKFNQLYESFFKEARGFDSQYLRDYLEATAEDLVYADKKLAEFYKDLATRLNQTNPDGDITIKDVMDSISGSFIEDVYRRKIHIKREVENIFKEVGR